MPIQTLLQEKTPMKEVAVLPEPASSISLPFLKLGRNAFKMTDMLVRVKY